MQVTSETTVTTPIETVWDKLSDHVGMSQWGAGLTVTMDKVGTPFPTAWAPCAVLPYPGLVRTSSRKS